MTGPASEESGPPSDVLERFAERFFEVDAARRSGLLQEFLAAHPGEAVALRRLCADLAGAERLLGDGREGGVQDHPEAIGNCRVHDVLGEGAFGVVYLCTQEVPVRREVAVKVLRPGAGDRNTLARFDAERQFLARLAHPAVAQVFDAGLLPDGRPYFVMEYVRGLPITAYCDRGSLAVEARLGLFARLCQGVQHAHEQGIVHRDLKPSNILVVEVDGVAQPKVIDFGIARAVSPEERERAELRTETGRIVGTPGYMSPEQAAGLRDEVDARSDLFSLGAILYELLTGELPWGRLPGSTDSEPPRPSQRVARDPTRTSEIARLRGSQPRKLASRLRGDLDWIVLKALAVERPRRYQSAQELASDIARHLRNEPVLAGPPALGYRLRKFGRRHRVAVAAAALTVVSATGILATVYYRGEAESRGRFAQEVVAGLLARANDPRIVTAPNTAELRRSLAQEALDFYDRFVRERPTDLDLREGRARTLWTLSQVHWRLGRYADAEAIAREAVADGEALLAEVPDSVKFRGVLGNAQRNLGRALYSSGKPAAARPWFERAYGLIERCHADAPGKYDKLLVALSMELLSTMNGATEAEAYAGLLERMSRLQEEVVRASPDSADDRRTLMQIDLQRLAMLVGRGEAPVAGQVLQRIETELARSGDEDPAILGRVHTAAAYMYASAGDNRASIERLEHAIAATRELCDAQPSEAEPFAQLGNLHAMLADQQGAAGDLHGAEATTRTAVELGEARITRFPQDAKARVRLAETFVSLVRVLYAQGRRSRLTDSEQLVQRGLALLQDLDPALEHEPTLRLRWRLLGHLGLLLDLAGVASGEVWKDAESALRAWREQFGSPEDASEYLDVVCWGSRRHFGAGDTAAAAGLLELAAAEIERHVPGRNADDALVANLCCLQALLSARQGDSVAAAEHAERAGIASSGWRGAVAAARGMYAAWQAARLHAAGAGVAPTALRDRAIELQLAAIDSLQPLVDVAPGDLWVEAPFAQARVRLGIALQDRGEAAAARTQLETGVASLEQMRAEVLADEWDEELFRAGKALSAR